MQISESVTGRTAASATSLAYWSTPERARKRKTRCAITPAGSHESDTDTFVDRIARVSSRIESWGIVHRSPASTCFQKRRGTTAILAERERATCWDKNLSFFFRSVNSWSQKPLSIHRKGEPDRACLFLCDTSYKCPFPRTMLFIERRKGAR